jgi:predicted nucleic acid-binding protein
VTAFVLDCSIAIGWLFEDEMTPEGDALMERVAREGAVVPALWHYEVANVLLQATRRSRIEGRRILPMLQYLSRLPIATEAEPRGFAWADQITGAYALGITVYDASYVFLARRLNLPLATRDAAVRRAVARSNGTVLPP